MNQSNWEKQLRNLALVAHYGLASPLAMVAILFFALPPSDEAWRSDYRSIFHLTAALSTISLLFGQWMYGQIMSQDTLDMRVRGVGFGSALSSFRAGVVLCLCLGDFSATLAVVAYVFTRNPTHLATLMGFWAIHYARTVIWIRRGQEDLKVLSNQVATADTKKNAA